jgi:peptidylprolyl isomerase
MQKYSVYIIVLCAILVLPITKLKAQTLPRPTIVYKNETIVEFITTEGAFKIKLYDDTPKHKAHFIKLVNEGFYDSLLFHRTKNEYIIEAGDPKSKHANDTVMLGLDDKDDYIPSEMNVKRMHKRGAVAMSSFDWKKGSHPQLFYVVHGRSFTPNEIIQTINNINKQNKVNLLNNILRSDSVNEVIQVLNATGNVEGVTVFMKRVQEVVDSLFEPEFFDPSEQYFYTYVSAGGLPHLDRQYTVFGEVVEGMKVVEKIAGVETTRFMRPKKNIRIIKVRIVD